MKRVLVIEPGFYTRVALDDELSQHGYQVTAVKTVESALIKMKTQIFHLILVSFDGMEQITFQMLMALRESFNHVPVIVITKRPTEDQLVRLSQFRPVEILVQPYAMVDLLDRMRGLLETREEQAR